MKFSRRSFLGGTLTAAGAAASMPVLSSCIQRMDPAQVIDLPPSLGGIISIQVSSYPDLNQVGGAVRVRTPDLPVPILVVQRAAGVFSAMDSVCSHSGCPVGYDPSAAQVVCPCHGSRFDNQTGGVVHPPAKQGLKLHSAVYDSAAGIVAVNLLSGDPNFPSVQNGKVVFTFAAFPELQSPGGSVVGTPTGYSGPITVIALPDGTFSALDATCTHLGCQVAFNSGAGNIQCPCHGSLFTPQGVVTQGPATQNLNQWPAVSDATGVTISLS